MAGLKERDWLSEPIFLKMVALLLAILLWGGVAAGRHGSARISVPVRVQNLSEDLLVSRGLPIKVDFEIAGPRLLLYLMRKDPLEVTLDFTGVQAGKMIFEHLDQTLNLEPGLNIMRVMPGQLTVIVEEVSGIKENHEHNERIK